MKITLAGSPGSGKSTLRRQIAERYGLLTKGTGEFMRDLSVKYGYSDITKFLVEYVSVHPEVDRQVDEEQRIFGEENEDLQQPVEIPQAVAMFDENKNYENISISYELFNDVIIWGLVNYPDLHTFFMEGAEVHGSKISFDRDIFKPLSKEHQFLHFKDIKKGSSITLLIVIKVSIQVSRS